MAYLEQVFIEGSSGAVLDSAAGTPNSQALTVQGNESGVPIPVEVQNASLAVTGTFWQATQPVSGTVTAEIEGHAGATLDAAPGSAIPTNAVMVGGSDGTDLRAIATDTSGQVKVLVEDSVAVTGTFWQTTQPVSGTVTAGIEGHAGATLDGAAGSPSSQCITIQGNSSGTEVPTLDAADVAQGSTTSGQVGPLVQMATVTSAPTDTNAKTNPLTGDAQGCLRVNVGGQTGSFKSYSQSKAGNVQNVQTVPSGKKWRLLCVSVVVSTSTNSATARYPSIYIEDASSNILCNIDAVATIVNVAAGTYYYTFGPSVATSSAIANSTATVGFPQFSIGPSFTVNGSLNGGISGDTFIVTLNVEEYND